MAHPLLDPFPFALMTLAICMVVFALTMAGLNAGADPDLGAGIGTQAVLVSPNRAVTKSLARPGVPAITPEARADQPRVI